MALFVPKTLSQIRNVPSVDIIATDGQAAVNELNTKKEPVIPLGTTAQYWRGDKTWQTLAAVTGEPAIPLGLTTQYWRGDKTWQTLSLVAEPVIPLGTTAQYWRGDKTWQTLSQTTKGYVWFMGG